MTAQHQAAAGIGNLLEALHADGVMQLQLTHHSVLVVVRSNSMDCFLADLRCLPALELGSGPSGVAYAYCDLQSLAGNVCACKLGCPQCDRPWL